MKDCQGKERGGTFNVKALAEKNERISRGRKRRAAPRKAKRKGKEVEEEKRGKGWASVTWGMRACCLKMERSRFRVARGCERSRIDQLSSTTVKTS